MDMDMDMALDQPDPAAILARAISIVDRVVDELHDEISHTPYSDESEIYRLSRILPQGPISLDRTIMVAAQSARGALDHISWIVHNNSPRQAIVLHALLRAALVGSGRIVFALLPSEPEVRLRNARVLLAQEGNSFRQALGQYASFEHLVALRPEAEYLDRATQQNAAIQEGQRPPGDRAVMEGAAAAIAAALAASGYFDQDEGVLREHIAWLWNTHSGGAHTHAWPRLLPGIEGSTFPGDFIGDFSMIASTAHIAMLCFKSRWRSGSANTTEPVPLT